MKTATRTAPRSAPAASSPRARARGRPEATELPPVSLRALEELNQLTSRLLAVADARARPARKDRAPIDDFGALVAHELPLIERQLEHMARTLDDLALVSRLSEGKVTLTRMRVRLSDAISSAVHYARGALVEGGHEVAVSIPGKALHVHADPARLSQALGTLLVQSSRRAARDDLLCVSATVENAEAVITVRDSATAVARPVASVFGILPTVEADVGPTASGLCIGLALVKALVALHGGSVMIESRGAGRPTSFEVRLPLLPD